MSVIMIFFFFWKEGQKQFGNINVDSGAYRGPEGGLFLSF